MTAAAQQIPGHPHLWRVDIGHRQHPAPQQHGNLMGVDFIVLRLPAVDGLHIERMAQDEGDALAGTQLGQPIPGKNALHCDDQVVSIRRDDAHEGLGRRRDILMYEHRARLVEDANIHGAGM